MIFNTLPQAVLIFHIYSIMSIKLLKLNCTSTNEELNWASLDFAVSLHFHWTRLQPGNTKLQFYASPSKLVFRRCLLKLIFPHDNSDSNWWSLHMSSRMCSQTRGVRSNTGACFSMYSHARNKHATCYQIVSNSCLTTNKTINYKFIYND